MSAQPHLDVVHGFGCAGAVRATRAAEEPASSRFRKASLPAFINDSQALWPVGRRAALRDLSSHAMAFVPLSEGSERITAMAVAPQRKHFALCVVSMTLRRACAYLKALRISHRMSPHTCT